MPTTKKRTQGRKNRAAGARFELKVRNSLENDGWYVDKWTNNVDLQEGKLIKAKRKFNPFSKVIMMSSGFPDLICFKRTGNLYEIIGVEAKANGWLDKEEKEKCKWLLENEVFSRVLIAKKGKKRGEIEYADFKEKY